MITKTENKTIWNKSINSMMQISLLITAIMMCMTSCKTKEDNDTGNDPDGMALNQRFSDNRLDNMQTFTLDAGTGGEITGSQGTKVIFPANAFGLNGVAVTGNVEVELIEIYDKATMLLNNMPTSGIRPNSDEEALKSAGEFFIHAKQNGTDLELLQDAQVESRGVGTAIPENMNVFRAGDGVDDNDLWQEADEDANGMTDIAIVGERETDNGYEIIYLFDISSFGWTNLDRWYSFTGQLTDLFVDVPSIFNGTNCEVYLTYDGEPTALARMDVYDTNVNMFTEHFGRLPVGQEVHIILVAEINGVLHATIQGATIVENHIEVMASPQPITEADLINAIDALP